MDDPFFLIACILVLVAISYHLWLMVGKWYLAMLLPSLAGVALVGPHLQIVQREELYASLLLLLMMVMAFVWAICYILFLFRERRLRRY